MTQNMSVMSVEENVTSLNFDNIYILQVIYTIVLMSSLPLGFIQRVGRGAYVPATLLVGYEYISTLTVKTCQ